METLISWWDSLSYNVRQILAIYCFFAIVGFIEAIGIGIYILVSPKGKGSLYEYLFPKPNGSNEKIIEGAVANDYKKRIDLDYQRALQDLDREFPGIKGKSNEISALRKAMSSM